MTYFQQMYSKLKRCNSVDLVNDHMYPNLIYIQMEDYYSDFVIASSGIGSFDKLHLPSDVINVLKEYYDLGPYKNRAIAKFDLTQPVSDSKENDSMDYNDKIRDDVKQLAKDITDKKINDKKSQLTSNVTKLICKKFNISLKKPKSKKDN